MNKLDKIHLLVAVDALEKQNAELRGCLRDIVNRIRAWEDDVRSVVGGQPETGMDLDWADRLLSCNGEAGKKGGGSE